MTELIVYSALNQKEKAGEVGSDIGDTIGKNYSGWADANKGRL